MNEDLIARRAAEQKEFEERVIRPFRELSLRQSWSESDEKQFHAVLAANKGIERHVLAEQEWLTCDGINELAWFEHPNLDRKRFVALAIVWCERIRHLFWGPNDWTNRVAWFDVYRAHVEGRGPHPHEVCQREASRPLATWSFDVSWANDAVEVLVWDEDPHKAAVYAGYAASLHRSEQTGVEDRELNFEKKVAAEAAVWSEFLAEYRDVAGNPFRSVTFDPTWCSESTVALARTMLEANAFDRMPILADALEDAGCDVEAVLSHCRSPNQVHVRGCWVVDLVLNRN